MSVMLFVAPSVALTSAVVFIRVARNALGANFMNQSLYMSTDLAMSSFHRSGLFKLTGIRTHSHRRFVHGFDDFDLLTSGQGTESPLSRIF